MASDPWVEFRGDLLIEHVAIIDAVVQATPGASRTTIVREIISEWVQRKCHEASLVHRVAIANGNAAESGRSLGGKGAA